MAKFEYRERYPSKEIDIFTDIRIDKISKLKGMMSKLIKDGVFVYKSSHEEEKDIYDEFQEISDSLGLNPIKDASRRKKIRINETKQRLSSVDLDYAHVNPHSETSFSPARPALIAFVCLDISNAAAIQGMTTLVDGEAIWKQLNISTKAYIANVLISYQLSIDTGMKKKYNLSERDWHLDYSCIKNTKINYREGKISFEYLTPYVNEHPITRKPAIANHSFIDLVTEPQIISREQFKIEDSNLVKIKIPTTINDCIHHEIKTFKWEKGLSIFIDNFRYMHGRLPYDMSLKRNVFIKQYRNLNLLLEK